MGQHLAGVLHQRAHTWLGNLSAWKGVGVSVVKPFSTADEVIE